jgi:nucleoside-diphosphate-sugar epimerase
MNALVTGAGGFLGLYIVEQLRARGDRVRALCRGRYPELEALDVEIVRADIRDARASAEACRGIDVVFHVAGVAGIWGPWSHYHSINVQGTANIIAACRKQRVPRLVYTSSPSVTFAAVDQCGIDESAPYPERWLCHYPHSKALAEQLVLAANGCEGLGHDGLATCALRPHLIWGPRDRHLIPRLLDRARSGMLHRVGNGKNLIDVVYVENAAAAHLAAADALGLDSPVAGRAYFISQGEPVNCWKWIDDLLALDGLPPVKKSISLATAWRIGSVLEMAHRLLGLQNEPRMTRFLAAQLGLSHYFSIARAQVDFGYQPSISTAAGMLRLRTALARKRRVD